MFKFAVCAVATGVAVSGASAAISWSSFGLGDAGFNAITNNGALERAVAEGRIGDRLAAGTWEQAIWRQGGVTMQTNANYVYPNGGDVPFDIVWNGVDTVTYTVGSQSLSWSAVPGAFTDIFIRTRSATDSTLELFDMDLDGLPIGSMTSSGNGDVQYIRITNDFANFGAFTLSGVSRLTWNNGNAPTNSALAYQVKLTNTTEIPSPSGCAVLGLAAIAACRRRR